MGLLFLFTIGKRLLPDHKGFSQQVKEDAKEYIAEMNVGPNYPFLDQSVATAGLNNLDGLYLIEIIRKSGRVSPVRNSTIIQAGDRLIFCREDYDHGRIAKNEWLNAQDRDESGIR